MKIKIPTLNKRRKFVLAVIILTGGVFLSQGLGDLELIVASILLSLSTSMLLFFILREDISGTFYFPTLLLPAFFTFSFTFFYPLIPARFLSRALLSLIYAFGLYSLFLSSNILAVSSIRTINLLRSARIVSFVMTITTLFLLTNIIYSLRLPLYLTPFIFFLIFFLLSVQSLWTYSLASEALPAIFLSSALISFLLFELSFILNLWPAGASIYSIFISGFFYIYLGLTHAWIEKRLFRGVLWEYVWVGFLSILILILFSNWGL